MKTSPVRATSITDKDIARTYDQVMAKINRSIDAFPWDKPEAYGAWLAQSFHMTKYTTRVAALTAGSFMIEDNELHNDCLSHLREEFGHEKLALTDLEHLGYTISDYPEFLQCKLMIQSQYYFIQRHPSAHFGFVLPLETIASMRGKDIHDPAKKKFGSKTISFIRVHNEVDQGHVGEMIHLINNSPKWVMPLIQQNLEQTGYLYSEMLDLAANTSPARSRKTA